MSEVDLPERLAKYDGDHVQVKRIALTQAHHSLPWFPASDKKRDTRYPWFVRNYGDRCWELDALDPNDLRALVRKAIRREIEPKAWKRCAVVEKAERSRCVMCSIAGRASMGARHEDHHGRSAPRGKRRLATNETPSYC
jgi:hypothetical protein